jgi:hypothetical protein
MTARSGIDRGAASASVDALRRRLYSPDVTAEDRERYRLATAAAVDEQPEPAPPRTAAPRPAHRRRLLLIGATTVLTAAAAAALLPHAPATSTPRPPAPVAVDPATRGLFVQNLNLTGSAGLVGYILEQSVVPLSVAHTSIVERSGTGPRTLALPVGGMPARGHAPVYLVTGRAAAAAWTASALRSAGDGRDRLLPVAVRAGRQRAGVPTVAAFPGRPPLRLRVAVPKGVRWGAAVVLGE